MNMSRPEDIQDAAEAPLEERLVDYHLEQLSEADRTEIQREISCGGKAQFLSQALGRLLSPLDALANPFVAPGLMEGILRRVRGSARRLPLAGSPRLGAAGLEDAAPEKAGRPPIRQRVWRESSWGWHRDLAATGVSLLVILAVLFPGLAKLRESSRRVVCASQLSEIGRALGSYALGFDASLPFAGGRPGSSWLYTGPDGAPRSSNSRHPFLLIRTGSLLFPGGFVCPSAREQCVSAQVDASEEDFPHPSLCTYDALNMAGPTPTVEEAPDLAYMTDPNPMFRYGVLQGGVDPRLANSPLHENGRGQNVLRLDGAVAWMTDPYLAHRDNLWMAGNRFEYDGTETQSEPRDAFMVPATPALRGPVPVSRQPLSRKNDRWEALR